MRACKIVSFFVVMILIAVVFAGVVTVPAAAQYDTMQFRYNAQHTGDYSPVAGSTPPNNQLKWKFTTGGAVYSSPTVANGVVYVGSGDGNLYALNATTGKVVWNYTTGGTVHSSPAVANGVVYVGSEDGNLYALNATTGTELWNYTTGGMVDTSSPAVANGVVYVGSEDGNLYALNANTGAYVWSYSTGGTVHSSPAVANGVVYIGSGSGNLYALNANTGVKLWNYTTGGMVDSSPAVANGLVYVASIDGTLFALNANTGALMWNYVTGSYMRSSPAVANGVVYVGNGFYDLSVYAIGNQTAPPSPLTITSIDPANNTANVQISKAINVTFNKTIQAGANYTNITLKKGTVKVNATTTIAGTKLTIKPNATLSYSTGYTVFIPRDGVKNGTQTMMTDFSSKFTTAAAPKTPTTLNATASKTTPTVKQNFTIKGRLTANGAVLTGKAITLRRSLDNKTFTTLTTRVTNATGWYQFSKNETTARSYYYRTQYAGNATCTNATSKVVKVTVKNPTAFTISTTPATPTFNKPFTINGALKSGTTALVGLSVHLERKVGSGSWADVAGTTKNTGTGGSVSVQQTMTTHHTYSYRWHFTGTGTYQPSYSLAKTFTV